MLPNLVFSFLSHSLGTIHKLCRLGRGEGCQKLLISCSKKMTKRGERVKNSQFVSISRVINHMTCYNLSALIGGKSIFLKKNPLQDFLSSLNAVISTNESTQTYNRSCDL